MLRVFDIIPLTEGLKDSCYYSLLNCRKIPEDGHMLTQYMVNAANDILDNDVFGAI